MLKATFLSLALLAVLAPGLFAQETAQPRKPGIGVVHLSAGPYIFDTAEQHQLRVTVVAKGLAHPFSIAFLPNGDALVVERGVGLRIIREATGAHPHVDSEMVGGVPAFPRSGTSGIQDVLLHPKFASNGLVFFTYNKTQTADGQQRPQLAGAVARGKFDGKNLIDVHEIFAGEWREQSSTLRIAFAPDDTLYITTGAPFSQAAADLSNVYGKVLRIRDDGSIPPDNPFAGKSGMRPEIFAYGMRDQLGIVYHAASGSILATDHGPQGGDEINLIRPGLDYGWPKYSFGRLYDGPRVSELPAVAGIEQPILLWIPSIAPSGLEVYTGNRFPDWKGNLFVGSAQRGELPRTGGLERVVLNPKLQELRRESLLNDLHLRIRFVRQGPDELLYVLAEQNGGGPDEDGAVLRLEPAPQEPQADEDMIRQRLATYSQARNHGDAHAEALCYAEDGDFRAGGPASRGRAEIEKALAVSVQGYDFALTVETVRFLDSNVAIADTHVVAGPAQHKIDMIGSYVMVKKGGTWLIEAARIARTQP